MATRTICFPISGSVYRSGRIRLRIIPEADIRWHSLCLRLEQGVGLEPDCFRERQMRFR